MYGVRHIHQILILGEMQQPTLMAAFIHPVTYVRAGLTVLKTVKRWGLTEG